MHSSGLFQETKVYNNTDCVTKHCLQASNEFTIMVRDSWAISHWYWVFPSLYHSTVACASYLCVLSTTRNLHSKLFFIKNTQGICCKINFNSNSSSFGVWFCFSFVPEAYVFFSGLPNKIDFDFRYGVCVTLGTTVGFAAIVDFFYLSYYYSFELDRSLPMPTAQKFSNENCLGKLCVFFPSDSFTLLLVGSFSC